jgi:hypothetical protein
VPVPEWLRDDAQWNGYLADVRQRPSWQDYPPAFYERLAGCSLRARFVAWSIFERGAVSTSDLQERGYDHPPRARKDVTDHGLRVLSVRRRSDATGRAMAVYSFAPPDQVLTSEQAGRSALPRPFVSRLVAAADNRCAVCRGVFDRTFLQADHRIPYAIAGNPGADLDAARFMAVCRSCNRAKSWACEHCPNWADQRTEFCATCYWADPERYEHVATQRLRRLAVVWAGDETDQFDVLAALAEQAREPLPDYVRAVLAAHVVSPAAPQR